MDPSRAPPPPAPRALRLAGWAAAAFGLVTVAAGGLVLLGPEAARAAAGQVVPLVLWGNFLMGFAYVGAGLGLARGRRWAVGLAAAIAAGTLLLGAPFAAHVLRGGAFERRTPLALAFRAGTWALLALWASRRLPARRAA